MKRKREPIDQENHNSRKKLRRVQENLSQFVQYDHVQAISSDSDGSSQQDKFSIFDKPVENRPKSSENENIMKLFDYVMKYNLSWKAFEEMTTLINDFDVPTQFPTSRYSIQKSLNKGFSPQYHGVCSNCSRYVGIFETKELFCTTCELSVKICDKDGSYFVTFQFEELIDAAIKKYQNSIIQFDESKQQSHLITDIFDGILYRHANARNIKPIITLVFNTDGVNKYKINHNSIWPILFVINELPPNIRFKEENVLVAGIFYGKAPTMNSFFKPFVDAAVKFNLNDENFYAIVPLICSCDCMAKYKVQERKCINAYKGCSYCNNNGQLIDKKFVRFTHNSTDVHRNVSESIAQMRTAAESGQSCMGYIGLPYIIKLEDFNIIWGFCIDYMHNSLLGVMKYITSRWFDSKYHKEPFYIGRQVAKVDAKLLSIRPPSNTSQKSMPISKRSEWKASDWKNFLLYYMYPALQGVLPQKYLDHIMIYSEAIFILLGDAIIREEINFIEKQLDAFVQKFEKFYGKISMTHNMHLTQHLCHSVRMSGPLWATSNFPFERKNGSLQRKVNGTTDVVKQLGRKVGYQMHRFLNEISSSKTKKSVNVKGKGKLCSSQESDEIYSLMSAKHLHLKSSVGVRFYQTIEVDGKLYHPMSYDRSQKKFDSLVLLKNDSIGFLTKIFKIGNRCYVVVDLRHKKTTQFSHVKLLYKKNNFVVCSGSFLAKKIIFVEGKRFDNFFEPPNSIEVE